MSSNAAATRRDGSGEVPRSTPGPSRTLPFWVWIVLLVDATAIGLIRNIDFIDRAIVNIMTLIFTFLGGIAVFIWFCFFSGYGRRLRHIVLFGVPLVLLILVGSFRVVSVSGELVPVIGWRWVAKADQLLPAAQPVVSTSIKPSPEATSAETPDSTQTATVPELRTVDLVTTTADDFPAFLGPKRNCWLPGPALARDWVTRPPKLLWRQPIGAGWSEFSAVNGFAVTQEQRGEDELVTCYEVLTGALRWTHSEQARHDETLGGVGPRATPTIFEGKVYTLGATGILNCLDGTTGKPLWTHRLQEEYGLTVATDMVSVAWGRAASPLIVDDLVVVPAGGPALGHKASLVAFRKDTGDRVWEGGEDQIGYASPSLATLAGVRQILSVNETTVTGHDPETGKVYWKFNWPGTSNQNANTSQAIAVANDQVFVSKGYMGGSALFKVECSPSGEWTTKNIWSDRTMMKTKFTNVIVREGYVYGLSDGTLECIELATGKRLWKHGRYGHGQILGVGDLIIVQAESGEVFLVALTPKQHQELGRLAAIEGKTWNNPALYGRYLLVRNAEQAACFELPLEEK